MKYTIEYLKLNEQKNEFEEKLFKCRDEIHLEIVYNSLSRDTNVCNIIIREDVYGKTN